MIIGYRRRNAILRIVKWLFLALVAWSIIETIYIRRKLVLGDRPPKLVNVEKIYIASLPWNNEVILRTHWINQLVELAKALGPENVFISIYENGSYDDTKGALRLLDEELDRIGVQRTFTLDELSHVEAMGQTPSEPTEGWIQTPESGIALRRIPYLAKLRNRVMEPLIELTRNGTHFDKVLFLNDVVYSTEDVLKLLQTKNGKYQAACALDFESPPKFYDTFALRDSDGNAGLMQTWPYFRSKASRRAVEASEPIPVRSCWNGMVAMHALPFVDPLKPLRFRGISDDLALSHVEGSECCLVHADNTLFRKDGIWINPNVRVGYCHPALHLQPAEHEGDYHRLCNMAYVNVHPAGAWTSVTSIFQGLWSNRIRRWLTTSSYMRSIVKGRTGAWTSEEAGRREPGEFCLVDEMQVIAGNGWAHV